jgi:5-hydroxyisourate hydrolase
MMGITTHVLDTVTGRPAAGVNVTLMRGDEWLASGVTDDDGRWLAFDRAPAGDYQLVFSTGDYFAGRSFHPRVTVEFRVDDASDNHHIPLLLSPYGYTTYRGS